MSDGQPEEFSTGPTATLLLADHAQVADGKLNVIGAGWTFTGPAPLPFALAGWVHVPWDLANTSLAVTLELLDTDGKAVMVDVPGEMAQPLAMHVSVEVGRPAGVPPGTTQDCPLALNCAPIALQPGQGYEWRLLVDGELLTRRGFRVRDVQTGAV